MEHKHIPSGHPVKSNPYIAWDKTTAPALVLLHWTQLPMNIYLVGMGIKINHNFKAAGVFCAKCNKTNETSGAILFFWTHLWPQLVQPGGEIECKQSERGVECIKGSNQFETNQSWYFIPIACTKTNDRHFTINYGSGPSRWAICA